MTNPIYFEEKPTNTPCPKCGSYVTQNGNIQIFAIGGVLTLIGVLLWPLLIIGLLLVVTSILNSLKEKIVPGSRFMSCKTCNHSRTQKKDLQEEVKKL